MPGSGRSPAPGRRRAGQDAPPHRRQPPRTLAPPGDIYRGYERLGLIADLAMGELSHRELAQRESVTIQEISEFAEAHMKEIAEVRAALAGQLAIETAGLWISKKQNRIAEYQDRAEVIRRTLHQWEAEGEPWSRSHRDMLKAYLDLMRQTADELGAYPQRQAAPARTGQTVHYIIETGNTGALQ